MTPRLYFSFRGNELPPFDKPRGTIGRGSRGEFDIPIEDPAVSRRGHAEIFFRGGSFWVRPLQSDREVRVDGGAPLQLADEVVLPAQATLYLGTARLELRMDARPLTPIPFATPPPAPLASPLDSAPPSPMTAPPLAPPVSRVVVSLPSSPPEAAPQRTRTPKGELPPARDPSAHPVFLQAAVCLGLFMLTCMLGLWLGIGTWN